MDYVTCRTFFSHETDFAIYFIEYFTTKKVLLKDISNFEQMKKNTAIKTLADKSITFIFTQSSNSLAQNFFLSTVIEMACYNKFDICLMICSITSVFDIVWWLYQTLLIILA